MAAGEDLRVATGKPPLPKIAGYTTESILGDGGMATVYLAIQDSLARYVALKVMNQILMADADFCRRFLNEGRLIAKLSHPNIVTVYDIGATEHVHYLSMTYLPGGTLREKIRRGLTVDNALYILKCLTDALGYAHRQGIVHRDIKPGNVLFTHSGAPVLTDFGIAKTVGTETRLTSTGMTIGSVGYMSPEQALGNEVDQRSDLYSLGVMFWQMLTGAMPYAAPDAFALAFKHAHDPVPELPSTLRRFQPLIAGLMAKRPEDRLGSAEELDRLIDELGYQGIPNHAPGPAEETVVLTRPAASAPHRTAPDRSAPDLADQGRPSTLAKSGGAPASPTRGRLGLATGLASLAAVAGVAGWLLSGGLAERLTQPRITTAGPPTEAPVQPARSPAEPARPVRAMPEDDGAQGPPRSEGAAQTGGQEQIAALLRQAEAQVKAGHLTEPPGDNAFETYSRVLDIDPEQPKAQAALVDIGRINAADKVFATADALLRQGALDDARRMIETGLKMNPDDERLLALQRALRYGQ